MQFSPHLADLSQRASSRSLVRWGRDAWRMGAAPTFDPCVVWVEEWDLAGRGYCLLAHVHRAGTQSLLLDNPVPPCPVPSHGLARPQGGEGGVHRLLYTALPVWEGGFMSHTLLALTLARPSMQLSPARLLPEPAGGQRGHGCFIGGPLAPFFSKSPAQCGPGNDSPACSLLPHAFHVSCNTTTSFCNHIRPGL